MRACGGSSWEVGSGFATTDHRADISRAERDRRLFNRRAYSGSQILYGNLLPRRLLGYRKAVERKTSLSLPTVFAKRLLPQIKIPLISHQLYLQLRSFSRTSFSRYFRSVFAAGSPPPPTSTEFHISKNLL